MNQRPMLNAYQRGLLQDTLLNLRGSLAEIELARDRLKQELKHALSEVHDEIAGAHDDADNLIARLINIVDELEHLQPREDAA